jgi:hypothetical protein
MAGAGPYATCADATDAELAWVLEQIWRGVLHPILHATTSADDREMGPSAEPPGGPAVSQLGSGPGRGGSPACRALRAGSDRHHGGREAVLRLVRQRLRQRRRQERRSSDRWAGPHAHDPIYTKIERLWWAVRWSFFARFYAENYRSSSARTPVRSIRHLSFLVRGANETLCIRKTRAGHLRSFIIESVPLLHMTLQV